MSRHKLELKHGSRLHSENISRILISQFDGRAEMLLFHIEEIAASMSKLMDGELIFIYRHDRGQAPVYYIIDSSYPRPVGATMIMTVEVIEGKSDPNIVKYSKGDNHGK